MECPLSQEEIKTFMEDLSNEAKREKFLTQQIQRYNNIRDGLLDKYEIFKGTFLDLLYNIHQFKNADMDVELKAFNDDEFINNIFNGLQISIRINDFVVLINKPTTFGEMSLLKHVIVDELSYDEANDIIVLQKKLGKKEILKIFKNNNPVQDISAVNYQEASVFFFATSIIYQIFLLLINSLGSYSRKK